MCVIMSTFSTLQVTGSFPGSSTHSVALHLVHHSVPVVRRLLNFKLG